MAYANIVQELAAKQLFPPGSVPTWMPESIQYLVIGGSDSYGVSSGDSDEDIVGFCIPPKDMVFPHLAGHIEGFGKKPQQFNTWQRHHIKDPSAKAGKGAEYDFNVYGITSYFHLTSMGNPNMVDSLFTPLRCIKTMTPLARHVRDNRHLFLSKKIWHTFRGYAFDQLNYLRNKGVSVVLAELAEFEKDHNITIRWTKAEVEEGLKGFNSGEYIYSFMGLAKPELETYLSIFNKTKSSRVEKAKGLNFDPKFGYHVVRLMLEIEQVLEEQDLDLERSREVLKSIRRGEWTVDRIEQYFKDKERDLDSLYHSSKLRHKPDEAAIKKLLVECLEQHFTSLDGCVGKDDVYKQALREIEQIIARTV